MATTTPVVKKRQYAVILGSGNVEVYHFETDTDVVILPTGMTLSQWISTIAAGKTLTLSGGVIGTADLNVTASGNIEIDVDVTDDGHEHTGATVKVSDPLRVVTSGENSDLVVSDVTTAELQCLKGAKSNLQAQIDALKAIVDKISLIDSGDTAPTTGKAGDFWMESLDQAESETV